MYESMATNTVSDRTLTLITLFESGTQQAVTSPWLKALSNASWPGMNNIEVASVPTGFPNLKTSVKFNGKTHA